MLDARTFAAQRTRQFGTMNPTRMDFEFWRYMVRYGESAFSARQAFSSEGYGGPPAWCFKRFGASRTTLPDGTVVCIGGEHEDYYDNDFCIYNDVVVVDRRGAIHIYGYPKDIFPPTDFHTATLCGDQILIVGGLGYADERGGRDTPVFSLDLQTYAIARIEPTGPSPGWIYRHMARLQDGDRALIVFGGSVIHDTGKTESQVDFEGVSELSIPHFTWRSMPDDSIPLLTAPGIEWPGGWTPVVARRAKCEIEDLRTEVPLGHPLFGADVRPLAYDHSKRVLFLLLDGTDRVADVELERNATCQTMLPNPTTVFYKNVEDWLAENE
jgi:hypothetical protein